MNVIYDKKKVLSVIMAAACLLSCAVGASAQEYQLQIYESDGKRYSSKTQIGNTEVFVFLDGIYLHFNDKPQIVNGSAMVPMRTIFEMFGCSVDWNESEKSATAVSKNGTVIKVQLDNAVMTKNGQNITLSVAPAIIGNSMMVPLRAISESLGADASWVEANAVLINTLEVDNNKVPMFSNKGKMAYIDKNEVYRYGDLGWYTNSNDALSKVYSDDGKMITLFEDEYKAYVNAGWHQDRNDAVTFLYSLDGRMVCVFNSQVKEYRSVGWYDDVNAVKTTLYAPNGKTVTVFKNEVGDYLSKGWYATQAEANKAAEAEAAKANQPYDANGKLIQVGNIVSINNFIYYNYIGEVVRVNSGNITVYVYDIRVVFSGRSLLNDYDKRGDIQANGFLSGIMLNQNNVIKENEMRVIN